MMRMFWYGEAKYGSFYPYIFMQDTSDLNLQETVLQWVIDRHGPDHDVNNLLKNSVHSYFFIRGNVCAVGFRDPDHATEFRLRWC